MRATKAYIASLGTTGVLLAGSLLMLAVVSAVVAFDRWPGGNVTAPVQTVVLDDKPAAIRVSESSTAPSAVRAPARLAAALRSTANAGPRAVVRTPALGNVLGVRLRGTAPTMPAAPVQKTVQNVQQTTYPLFEAVSNPGTTAGQIADGVQTVTDATGTGLNA